MTKRDRIRKKLKAQPGALERRAVRQRLAQAQDPLGIGSPLGLPKMSVVLKELARPWLDKASSVQDMQVSLQAAAVAWNLSLLPRDQRSAALKKGHRLNREQKDLIQQMVGRKEELFPDDTRSVEGVQVASQDERRVNINVVSALGGPPSEPPPPPTVGIKGRLKRLLPWSASS